MFVFGARYRLPLGSLRDYLMVGDIAAWRTAVHCTLLVYVRAV